MSFPIPYLIGVTGRAQHGKDTIGQLLVESGYKRFAFADALKSMALVLDPLVVLAKDGVSEMPLRLSEVVAIRGWESAKTDPEVRRFLQVLGTEGVRDHLGEDAWVNALALKAVPLFTNGVPVVVTDVRFPNEAAWVRRMSGEVWRVRRGEWVSPEPENDYCLVNDWVPFDNGLPVDHPSEAHVDSMYADLDIANEGTLEELQRKVRHYMGVRGLPEEVSRFEQKGVTP